MQSIKTLFWITVLCIGCSHPEKKTSQEVLVVESPLEVADKPVKEFQNGDIIFHTSLSNQSLAIQIASKSKYSHVGVIFEEGKDWLVYEAVQPVKRTPLNDWIKRGDGGHYVVKRLKNSEAVLTPEGVEKMREYGKKYLGKDYDLKFEWSDDKIYCSELVWKIYKETFGIEIGKLEKIKDFDLSDPIVQEKLKQRYGNHVPLEEWIITPGRMYESDLLETIIEK